MAVRSGIVTLLTDFGTADGFVGAVKGAVLSVCKGAVQLVDLAHDVPPGDVAAAAFALMVACPRFPRGTVHLAVVDPGVGSIRRALVVTVGAGDAYLVGPDNGIFSWLLDDARSFECVAVDLAAFPGASATFHGRDVFAPVAGRLAAGEDPDAFGRPVGNPVRLPRCREPIGTLKGRVVRVDRFGNVVTSLQPLGGDYAIGLGGVSIPRRVLCYAEIPAGEIGWYVGSLGLIEVGMRNASAARQLRVDVGAPASIVPR